MHGCVLRPGSSTQASLGDYWKPLQVSDTGAFALQVLTGLQQLTMAGCAGVGNGAVGALGRLTSLRHLDLRWCTFGDKGEPHALLHRCPSGGSLLAQHDPCTPLSHIVSQFCMTQTWRMPSIMSGHASARGSEVGCQRQFWKHFGPVRMLG